jgi:hypothetical protein
VKTPKAGLCVFGLTFIVVVHTAPTSAATHTHVIHIATRRTCEWLLDVKRPARVRFMIAVVRKSTTDR